ncbi:MAG: hypothetical protein WC725_03675 [Patescibacteria group bacterium]|jgi:hypothetical protein
MKENIKQIIAELCELDPELKNHEDKLIKIIENFLAAKPDTKFDEKFARTLKAKILSESMPEKKVFGSSFLSVFYMKKYLILSGATLAVLIIAVTLREALPTLVGPKQLTSNKPNITRVASGAFGSLTGQQTGSEQVMPKATSNIAPMYGRGGGGGGVASMGVAGSSGTATLDAAVSPAPDAKMMIYRPYQIKYVYKGDKLEQGDKNLDVLRRVKPELNTSGAVSVLNKLSFGGLNLGTFANTQVTNFELAQKDSKGYITNVDLRNGSISISQNYNANPCPNGVCPVYQPLRPSEMLSDETLISLSNDFLKGHGVDLSNYGEPVVQNDWRKGMETAASDFAPYVPDIISVLYPQKINGTLVYELGGGESGLTVNVDVRNKQVSGAWNITNQNFEAAQYEAETDTARIIKIAENGGIYGSGYMDPSAEIIELELGTPTRVLTKTWKNDGSGEIIVPALYFPILKAPTGKQFYFQTALVVPLIKELLQEPSGGPIQLMKGSVTPASPPEVKGL